MREIKFRAWDENLGVMKFEEEFELLHEKDNGCHAFGYADNGDVSPYKLMQYTGLRDKNGVEIYENDLIRHEDFNSMGEVTFKRGCFRAFDFTLANFEAIHDISKIEIIGNIYEQN